MMRCCRLSLLVLPVLLLSVPGQAAPPNPPGYMHTSASVNGVPVPSVARAMYTGQDASDYNVGYGAGNSDAGHHQSAAAISRCAAYLTSGAIVSTAPCQYGYGDGFAGNPQNAAGAGGAVMPYDLTSQVAAAQSKFVSYVAIILIACAFIGTAYTAVLVFLDVARMKSS